MRDKRCQECLACVYRGARKWRGSYQRSSTIVRITRGYLSCNDSAWVYTWQVDTLLYRRVLNLPDSHARCLVKYMEVHSASRYWRAPTRNLHSSAIRAAMYRAVGGLINCTVVKTRMLTPEIAPPVTNSAHSTRIGINN